MTTHPTTDAVLRDPPHGALTTAHYKDMDDMNGTKITLHGVCDGENVTVSLGHMQCRALALALAQSGKPIMITKDGTVSERRQERREVPRG